LKKVPGQGLVAQMECADTWNVTAGMIENVSLVQNVFKYFVEQIAALSNPNATLPPNVKVRDTITLKGICF